MMTEEKINGEALDAATVRLVIAARDVAYADVVETGRLRELDRAVEAFAEAVPWDDEPETAPRPAGNFGCRLWHRWSPWGVWFMNVRGKATRQRHCLKCGVVEQQRECSDVPA